MKVLELDEMLGTDLLFCPNSFNHHGPQISKGKSLVSVLNSTKKYPFVLQRGDAKKTGCLQLECNPTAITFQFEEKVLAKDHWLQRNLHSSTESS